jgi:hypothetical protein
VSDVKSRVLYPSKPRTNHSFERAFLSFEARRVNAKAGHMFLPFTIGWCGWSRTENEVLFGTEDGQHDVLLILHNKKVSPENFFPLIFSLSF